MPEMRPRRVDVVGPGALVLARMLGVLGLSDLIVSEWGLREALLVAVGSGKGSFEPRSADAVEELASA